ncbi:MAG: hypothetical protein K9L68_07850 [Spirochaetales bacterium]|nr:hypothetical protein [Spirochaetales bacterium]MCF7938495.1 hypothetical protein [Spirochaetales bacterium]
MLYERSDVRQIPEEGNRRWFSDDFFDLIIWYDSKDEIDGFQLCYDKGEYERAFTWRKSGSVTHHAIDTGDEPGSSKMSPVLVQDGRFDSEIIRSKFVAAAVKIEPELTDLVDRVLADYSNQSSD